MEHKVRMADIAEKLGISVVSVSKALSGKEGVSDGMREKIKTVAREMGYVPLRKKADAVKPDTSGNIGILVSERFLADNNFYTSLYYQVSLQCNECGYSALFEIVSGEAERSCTMPAMVQGKKVDGLIFMGQIGQNYIREVGGHGIPFILLDFYAEELKANSVTSDNLSGGYRLTKHLLDEGYQDIAFVGSIGATSSIMDRFLGYAKALMKAGIPLRREWVLEDRDAMGALLPIRLPERMPRAFVCSCDEEAINMVQHLKQCGYRVPEDVAVAGYDDYRLAVMSKPQLTTYRVNVEHMAAVTVKQLVGSIRGEEVIHGNILVDGVLVRREST